MSHLNDLVIVLYYPNTQHIRIFSRMSQAEVNSMISHISEMREGVLGTVPLIIRVI